MPRRPPVAAAEEASTAGAELAALARTLSAEARTERDTGPAQVGWSLRAAVLAGLCASLLQAGMVIASAQGVVEIIPGLKLDVGQGSALTPLFIVSGLWGGARVAAGAVMVSHFLLRALGRSGSADYALCGGVIGGAHALLMGLLGAPHGVLGDALTGLAAGFLYRMFAGTSREPQASSEQRL